MRDVFRRFARVTADKLGSPWAFLISLLVIIVWAITGPLFHYSDTWQLLINTATTVVTFLMVFVIQSTQNRDAVATHLKLDELLRAIEPARNGLIDLEDLTDEQLDHLKTEFAQLSQSCSQEQAITEAVVSEQRSREVGAK